MRPSLAAVRLLHLSIYSSLVSYLPFSSATFQLQILHNNDMHSKFEEVDVHGRTCSGEGEECYGGFARTKWAADDETRKARQRNISSIFINAGDTFQGTPYYSLLKWQIVQPLFDALELNVTTLGNHEFDDGVDNLVKFLQRTKTPVLACNLNYSSDERLRLLPRLTPSVVLNVDGTNVGLIGYLTPTTMTSSHAENVEIFDEIPSIRREARKLRAAGVKIIIAVGHSGFVKDAEIAEQIAEISVVVGAHSHTLLYTPKDNAPSVEHALEDYPFMVEQVSGKKVPVVQAFCDTKYLGKLIVTFNDEGDVISATGNPILLDSTFKKDRTVDELVRKWLSKVEINLKSVVGYTRVNLQRADFQQQRYESNFGNLIADAVLDYDISVNNETNREWWTSAPIVMIHQGAIRCNIENSKNNGAITVEDIMTTLPFANIIMEVRIPGSSIMAALEHSAAADRFMKNYLHFFGLRVIYDLKKPIGQRVRSVHVLCRNCSVPTYEPLQLETIYSIIVDDFIKRGADGYTMFQNLTVVRKLDIKYSDALKAYLEKRKFVYPKLEGRITIATSSGEQTVASYRSTYSIVVLVATYLQFCVRYLHSSP